MKSKKLNVMKTRPDISDAEIRSMMDFNKVLDLHNTAKRTRSILMILASGVIIALLVGWVFLIPRKEESVGGDVKTGKDIILPEVKQPIANPEPTVVKPAEPIKPKQEKTEKHEPAPTPKVEAEVYTDAEPIKGYEDLYAYFKKELKYPPGVTSAVQGDVAVTFLINRQGKPEQIKFQNSLGPEFDQEVIRVINNMPEWKPATQNGKPIPAKITQSFTFSIKN